MKTVELIWTAGRWLDTCNGERFLRTAPATKAFWAAWRADKIDLQDLGFSPAKDQDTGAWVINHWGRVDAPLPVIVIEAEAASQETLRSVIIHHLSKVSEAQLKEIASIIGQRTGTCCICSRELTHPVSVASGIGPVCADRWGIDRLAGDEPGLTPVRQDIERDRHEAAVARMEHDAEMAIERGLETPSPAQQAENEADMALHAETWDREMEPAPEVSSAKATEGRFLPTSNADDIPF